MHTSGGVHVEMHQIQIKGVATFFVNVVNEGTSSTIYPIDTTNDILNINHYGTCPDVCDYHSYQIDGKTPDSSEYSLMMKVMK